MQTGVYSLKSAEVLRAHAPWLKRPEAKKIGVIMLYGMRAIMKMTFDPNAPNVPDAAAELRNGSRAYLVGRIGLGPDGLRADVIEVLVTTLKRTAGPRS